MAYDVLASQAAARDIRRLPPETRPRVRDAILALREDPRARAQKLAVEGAYRVRVGDYRIVFRVDDTAREVLITRVRHRRDVYRRRRR
ncbi:MAG TPA: type II toxin-antitoxin system RelE/ParE family toxin [Solirubrobacterales bacterium]|nr:type II toxin-antitoxin system RelE/ParE family toxin [Solirubrobacterales bacterium]